MVIRMKHSERWRRDEGKQPVTLEGGGRKRSGDLPKSPRLTEALWRYSFKSSPDPAFFHQFDHPCLRNDNTTAPTHTTARRNLPIQPPPFLNLPRTAECPFRDPCSQTPHNRPQMAYHGEGPGGKVPGIQAPAGAGPGRRAHTAAARKRLARAGRGERGLPDRREEPGVVPPERGLGRDGMAREELFA
jgi:hypothetical protein